MSEVWLAKHTVLAIPVVFETLRKSIAELVGEAGGARMFNEARLMARVTSPRVVRAIDAGTLGTQPYLVQEYVDGVDMAELDRERRASLGVGLPLWTVCYVMEETCRALHAAHQAGVIHRDVKPSNLFAAPETGSGWVTSASRWPPRTSAGRRSPGRSSSWRPSSCAEKPWIARPTHSARGRRRSTCATDERRSPTCAPCSTRT